MLRNVFQLAAAISALAIWCTTSLSWPSTDMQHFESDCSGWGLTGHDVTGDGLTDLITSYWDNEGEGGMLWRNDYDDNVLDLTPIQNLVMARECKFGEIVPGEPWYLAMACRWNEYSLTTYEVYETSPYLRVLDEFGTYHMDYISWGHIDGLDDWMDLVATDWDLSGFVRIFNGSSDGTLDYWGYFDCGSNRDPDQIALAPMDDRYTDDEWELITQDAYGSNANIRVYDNDGNGSFTTTNSQCLNVGIPIEDFVIGDIDRDSYMDLVVCGYYNVKTYLNDQNGRFETTPNNSYEFENPVTQITLGDCNKDGYPDILCYSPSRAIIYLNQGTDDPGEYDFTSEDWAGEVSGIYYGLYFVVEELLFVDLKSKGAYSVVMTGNDNSFYPQYTSYYLCVFFDNSNPQVQPVQHIGVIEGENNHPLITWEPNEDLDIDKYTIYRALMDTSTTHPIPEDFDSLSTVDHPTTSYTDTTVVWHSPNSNYYIWYAVTGIDENGNESCLLEYARGWGYYEDGEISEIIWFNQPDKFNFSVSPNPFNPVTTLRYDLPENAHVKLAVYDISGRLVSTLMDMEREAGSHHLTWDAGHLPSGVYIYHIEAGNYSSTGKMILTK